MADGIERRVGLRPVSVAVLVVLLAGTIGAFVALRNVVDDQERRLLTERTKEAQALVNGTFSALPATLGGLVGIAAAAPSPAAFVPAATPLVSTSSTASGYRYLELLRKSADGLTVVAVAGPAPEQAGAQVTDAVRAGVITRALDSGKLVSTPVYERGGEKRLGLATAAVGYAVYAVGPVHPYAGQDNGNAPFHEIYGALYAAPTAKADQLISASTKNLPLTGHTAQAVVGAGVQGADLHWLLVAKARRPLAGSAAHAAPWVVLGAGIALALLASASFETLIRRRRYALDLVDERTAELRASLQELERTQQELIRKERLAGIGQLASAVGHELRNPLGVLTNVLFLIRSKVARHNGGAVPEDLTRQLDTADREVTAASLIVSDLLEFARAREPVRAPVDLEALVEESLSVAPPPAHVRVVRRHADGLPALSADRDQLRQVILNLLTNAYQATPGPGREAGTVTIATGSVDGVVSLSVEDDGEGISEATKVKLFEPFFTTKAKGVGLGLAVSRRIAESHGGSLECDSESGRGTTFRMVIPAVGAQRGASEPVQTASATGGEG